MPDLPDLRRWLIGIAGSIVTAIAVASLFGVVTMRDQINRLENQFEVPGGAKHLVALDSRLVDLAGRVKAIEDWRAEGRRFTYTNGEHLEGRLHEQIEDLRRRVEHLERD